VKEQANFWGCEAFLRKLARKKDPQENDFQKKNDCISRGAVSHVKALQAPSLPKFLPTYPKTAKLKHNLQKKSSLLSWVPFL